MNRAFQKDQPFKQQADMLASKGRYGDSMLVHMNPREVDVLRSMTPNNALTINPDTGQPEAFLPLLLALGGGLLGASGVASGLGLLGTAGGLAAVGSGVGTAIETGSLEQGLKAGLISGVLGGIGGKFLGGTAGALGSGTSGGTLAPVGQTLADVGGSVGVEAALQTGGGEVAKQGLMSTLQDLTQKELAQIGGAALTGQGLTDQYNLMNMPLGMADDDEDFYVPVNLDDRGVRFPAVARGGRSSEKDYFANPFSYTRAFQTGGPVGGPGTQYLENADDPLYGPTTGPFNPAVGGTANTTAQAAGDSIFQNLTPTGTEQYDLFTPRALDTPLTLGTRGFADAPVIDYNRRLFGDPTATRTTYESTPIALPETLVEETTTTTTSDPTDATTDPNQDPGGAPGSDYEGGNTTGDPTAPGQTPGEPGIPVLDTTGTGIPGGDAAGFNLDDYILADDIDDYIADYFEANPFDPGIDTTGFITAEDLTTQLDDFDPFSGVDTTQFLTSDDLTTALSEFDPGIDTSGFITAEDLTTQLDDFNPLAGFDTSGFLTASDIEDFVTASDLPSTSGFITAEDLSTELAGFDPGIDTTGFITAEDLSTALTGFDPGIDTSSFLTTADLPAAIDTSQFLTAADLPASIDTSQFLTAGDLPTYEAIDTSQFLTAGDLPTFDTSEFLTATDLPVFDTSSFLTAADLPTAVDTSSFLTAADLPTAIDTSAFLTAADLPAAVDTSAFLTAADLPTFDTSSFLTAADLPTAFNPSSLQQQINTLATSLAALPKQTQTAAFAPSVPINVARRFG